MENFKFDDAEWAKAMYEMPFGRPGSDGRGQHYAATRVGNALMSIEREPGRHGKPLYFGRLLQYGDECIVVSHGDVVSKGKWVWQGPKELYYRTWEAD